MCDPMTAALGAQAAGAGMSAVGAFAGAQGQKRSLRFQATMDELSAERAKRTAQDAIRVGQVQEQQLRLKAAALKGKQRAGMAANNVVLGEGSAQRVEASTDYLTEVDANTIQANAMRAAFGYRAQALNLENDALLKRATAKGISPTMAAVGSLLGSASSMATTYYAGSKVGATGGGG